MRILLPALIFASAIGCDRKDDKPPGESAAIGRYQLIQLGSMRRDQFLLDTSSGKIWRTVCYYKKRGSSSADCDLAIWDEEKIIGINTTSDDAGKLAEFYKEMDKK